MAVGGIGTGGYGAYGASSYPTTGASRQTGKAAGGRESAGTRSYGMPESGGSETSAAATTDFLREARKTPAERIREDWLERHNLSEEDLQKMSPDARKAIEDALAQEMRRRLTGTSDQRGSMVDLSA